MLFFSVLSFSCVVMFGSEDGRTLHFTQADSGSSHLPKTLTDIKYVFHKEEQSLENLVHAKLGKKHSPVPDVKIHEGALVKHSSDSESHHLGVHVGEQKGKLLDASAHVAISDFTKKIAQKVESKKLDGVALAIVGKGEDGAHHVINCSNFGDFMTEFHKRAEQQSEVAEKSVSLKSELLTKVPSKEELKPVLPQADTSSNKLPEDSSAPKVVENKPQPDSSFSFSRLIPQFSNTQWMIGGGVVTVLAALVVYFDGLNKIKQMAGY